MDGVLKRGKINIVSLASIGFLVVSLIAIVGVTENPLKSLALNAWAGGVKRVKTWRDIGNPRAGRHAGKVAEENNQAAANKAATSTSATTTTTSTRPCSTGCTLSQVTSNNQQTTGKIGYSYTNGDIAGFYQQKQSDGTVKYYPIAESAGGPSASDLNYINAPPPSTSSNNTTSQTTSIATTPTGPIARTNAACGVGFIAEETVCVNHNTGQVIDYKNIVFYNIVNGSIGQVKTTVESAYGDTISSFQGTQDFNSTKDLCVASGATCNTVKDIVDFAITQLKNQTQDASLFARANNSNYAKAVSGDGNALAILKEADINLYNEATKVLQDKAAADAKAKIAEQINTALSSNALANSALYKLQQSGGTATLNADELSAIATFCSQSGAGNYLGTGCVNVTNFSKSFLSLNIITFKNEAGQEVTVKPYNFTAPIDTSKIPEIANTIPANYSVPELSIADYAAAIQPKATSLLNLLTFGGLNNYIQTQSALNAQYGNQYSLQRILNLPNLSSSARLGGTLVGEAGVGGLVAGELVTGAVATGSLTGALAYTLGSPIAQVGSTALTAYFVGSTAYGILQGPNSDAYKNAQQLVITNYLVSPEGFVQMVNNFVQTASGTTRLGAYLAKNVVANLAGGQAEQAASALPALERGNAMTLVWDEAQQAFVLPEIQTGANVARDTLTGVNSIPSASIISNVSTAENTAGNLMLFAPQANQVSSTVLSTQIMLASADVANNKILSSTTALGSNLQTQVGNAVGQLQATKNYLARGSVSDVLNPSEVPQAITDFLSTDVNYLASKEVAIPLNGASTEVQNVLTADQNLASDLALGAPSITKAPTAPTQNPIVSSWNKFWNEPQVPGNESTIRSKLFSDAIAQIQKEGLWNWVTGPTPKEAPGFALTSQQGEVSTSVSTFAQESENAIVGTTSQPIIILQKTPEQLQISNQIASGQKPRVTGTKTGTIYLIKDNLLATRQVSDIYEGVNLSDGEPIAINVGQFAPNEFDRYQILTQDLRNANRLDLIERLVQPLEKTAVATGKEVGYAIPLLTGDTYFERLIDGKPLNFTNKDIQDFRDMFRIWKAAGHQFGDVGPGQFVNENGRWMIFDPYPNERTVELTRSIPLVNGELPSYVTNKSAFTITTATLDNGQEKKLATYITNIDDETAFNDMLDNFAITSPASKPVAPATTPTQSISLYQTALSSVRNLGVRLSEFASSLSFSFPFPTVRFQSKLLTTVSNAALITSILFNTSAPMNTINSEILACLNNKTCSTLLSNISQGAIETASIPPSAQTNELQLSPIQPSNQTPLSLMLNPSGSPEFFQIKNDKAYFFGPQMEDLYQWYLKTGEEDPTAWWMKATNGKFNRFHFLALMLYAEATPTNDPKLLNAMMDAVSNQLWNKGNPYLLKASNGKYDRYCYTDTCQNGAGVDEYIARNLEVARVRYNNYNGAPTYATDVQKFIHDSSVADGFAAQGYTLDFMANYIANGKPVMWNDNVPIGIAYGGFANQLKSGIRGPNDQGVWYANREDVVYTYGQEMKLNDPASKNLQFDIPDPKNPRAPVPVSSISAPLETSGPTLVNQPAQNAPAEAAPENTNLNIGSYEVAHIPGNDANINVVNLNSDQVRFVLNDPANPKTAEEFAKETGSDIVINTDGFDQNTFQPAGDLVAGGGVYKGFTDQNGKNGEMSLYFDQDGKPILKKNPDGKLILPKGKPNDFASQVSFPNLLINGGEIQDSSGFDTQLNSRTAIGFTNDGKVTIISVQGSQTPNGSGLTGTSVKDLQEYGKSLGLDILIAFDGGGSSRLVVNSNSTLNTLNAAENNKLPNFLGIKAMNGGQITTASSVQAPAPVTKPSSVTNQTENQNIFQKTLNSALNWIRGLFTRKAPSSSSTSINTQPAIKPDIPLSRQVDVLKTIRLGSRVTNLPYSLPGQIDLSLLIPEKWYSDILPKLNLICTDTTTCLKDLQSLPLTNSGGALQIGVSPNAPTPSDLTNLKALNVPVSSQSLQVSKKAASDIQGFMNGLTGYGINPVITGGYSTDGIKQTGLVIIVTRSNPKTGVSNGNPLNIGDDRVNKPARDNGMVRPTSDNTVWLDLNAIQPGLVQSMFEAGLDPNSPSDLVGVLLGIEQAYEAQLPTNSLIPGLPTSAQGAALENPLPLTPINKPQYLSENSSGAVFFTGNYKPLPKKNFVDEYVAPQGIVLHWDENPYDPVTQPDLYTTKLTYKALIERKTSVHFGVSPEGVTQFMPMKADSITQSYGNSGLGPDINIEFVGINFNKHLPPQAEINNGVDLVARLVVQYKLDINSITHHIDQEDVNPEFVELIKNLVRARIAQMNTSASLPQQVDNIKLVPLNKLSLPPQNSYDNKSNLAGYIPAEFYTKILPDLNLNCEGANCSDQIAKLVILEQPGSNLPITIKGDYVPPNLVNVKDNIPNAVTTQPNAQIREDAVQYLKGFVDEMNALGYTVNIRSAYRTPAEQQQDYLSDPSSAMPPGYSQHQSGIAVDLGFTLRPGYKGISDSELRDIAHKHGIIHSYNWDPPHYLILDAAVPGLTATMLNLGYAVDDLPHEIVGLQLGVLQTLKYMQNGQPQTNLLNFPQTLSNIANKSLGTLGRINISERGGVNIGAIAEELSLLRLRSPIVFEGGKVHFQWPISNFSTTKAKISQSLDIHKLDPDVQRFAKTESLQKAQDRLVELIQDDFPSPSKEISVAIQEAVFKYLLPFDVGYRVNQMLPEYEKIPSPFSNQHSVSINIKQQWEVEGAPGDVLGQPQTIGLTDNQIQNIKNNITAVMGTTYTMGEKITDISQLIAGITIHLQEGSSQVGKDQRRLINLLYVAEDYQDSKFGVLVKKFIGDGGDLSQIPNLFANLLTENQVRYLWAKGFLDPAFATYNKYYVPQISQVSSQYNLSYKNLSPEDIVWISFNELDTKSSCPDGFCSISTPIGESNGEHFAIKYWTLEYPRVEVAFNYINDVNSSKPTTFHEYFPTGGDQASPYRNTLLHTLDHESIHSISLHRRGIYGNFPPDSLVVEVLEDLTERLAQRIEQSIQISNPELFEGPLHTAYAKNIRFSNRVLNIFEINEQEIEKYAISQDPVGYMNFLDTKFKALTNSEYKSFIENLGPYKGNTEILSEKQRSYLLAHRASSIWDVRDVYSHATSEYGAVVNPDWLPESYYTESGNSWWMNTNEWRSSTTALNQNNLSSTSISEQGGVNLGAIGDEIATFGQQAGNRLKSFSLEALALLLKFLLSVSAFFTAAFSTRDISSPPPAVSPTPIVQYTGPHQLPSSEDVTWYLNLYGIYTTARATETAPTGLTSIGTGQCVPSGHCDGARMWDLYLWYKGQTGAWWYHNGQFTPKDFLALMILGEVKGSATNNNPNRDAEFYSALTSVIKNQLWGSAPDHEPYCTTSDCTAGIMNFLGAYVQSAWYRYDGLNSIDGSDPYPETLTNLGSQQDKELADKIAANEITFEDFGNAIFSNSSNAVFGNDAPTQWGCLNCGDPNLKWVGIALNNNAKLNTFDKCGIAGIYGQDVIYTLNQEYTWSKNRGACTGK